MSMTRRRRPARKCLEAIEGHNGASLVQAAVRLLASRNPAGAAEALLNYLPFADDESVVQEIETALRAVGLRQGKPESSLVRALTDPAPVRRSIAARVLCQIGGAPDARPSVPCSRTLGQASACRPPSA